MNIRSGSTDPSIIFILSLSYSLWGLAFSSYSYLVRYYVKDLAVPYTTQAFLETMSNILSIILLILIIVAVRSVGRIRTILLFNSLATLSPLSLVISSFVGATGSHMGVNIALVTLSSSFVTGIVVRNLLLIDIGGRFLGQLIGIVMTVNSMTMIIGPLLGYYIKEIFGYQLYFLAVTLMFLLSSLLILSLKNYYKEQSDRISLEDPKKLFITSLRELFSIGRIERYLYPFIIFVAIDRFSYNVWAQLLFALTSYENISSEIAAYFSTIQYMSWFLSQYLLGSLTDKINPIYILTLSEILTGVTAMILGVGILTGGTILLMISAVLIGLSIASWIPSYNKTIQIFVSSSERPFFLSKINIYALMLGSPGPYIGGLIKNLYIQGTMHLFISSLIHIINASVFTYLMKRRTITIIN